MSASPPQRPSTSHTSAKRQRAPPTDEEVAEEDAAVVMASPARPSGKSTSQIAASGSGKKKSNEAAAAAAGGETPVEDKRSPKHAPAAAVSTPVSLSKKGPAAKSVAESSSSDLPTAADAAETKAKDSDDSDSDDDEPKLPHERRRAAKAAAAAGKGEPFAVLVPSVEVSLGTIIPEAIRRQLLSGLTGTVRPTNIRYRTETGTATVTVPASQKNALLQAVHSRQVFGHTIHVAEVDNANDICSASVESSKQMSDNAFMKLMKDVPGFLHGHRKGKQLFHAVFASKDRLFATKALLDEFEPEAGVRFNVVLGDKAMEAFAKYVAERGANGSD